MRSTTINKLDKNTLAFRQEANGYIQYMMYTLSASTLKINRKEVRKMAMSEDYMREFAQMIANSDDNFEINFPDCDNHIQEIQKFYTILIEELTKNETQQIRA